MTVQGEKTCEELAEEEQALADHQKNCGQPGEFAAHFFGTLSDRSKSYEKSVAYYLYCVGNCFAGNNDETVCCGCEETETGCDDLEQCPNRVCGLGYAELARAAIKVASMRYIPIKGEFTDGTVLVYDSKAMPDNQPADCDPCADQQVGAFEAKSLDELFTEFCKKKGLL